MYISIDQSTSSTTVFLYDKNLKLLDKFAKSHKQIQKGEDTLLKHMAGIETRDDQISFKGFPIFCSCACRFN